VQRIEVEAPRVREHRCQIAVLPGNEEISVGARAAPMAAKVEANDVEAARCGGSREPGEHSVLATVSRNSVAEHDAGS
jgi:hypothetical protein